MRAGGWRDAADPRPARHGGRAAAPRCNATRRSRSSRLPCCRGSTRARHTRCVGMAARLLLERRRDRPRRGAVDRRHAPRLDRCRGCLARGGPDPRAAPRRPARGPRGSRDRALASWTSPSRSAVAAASWRSVGCGCGVDARLRRLRRWVAAADRRAARGARRLDAPKARRRAVQDVSRGSHRHRSPAVATSGAEPPPALAASEGGEGRRRPHAANAVEPSRRPAAAAARWPGRPATRRAVAVGHDAGSGRGPKRGAERLQLVRADPAPPRPGPRGWRRAASSSASAAPRVGGSGREGERAHLRPPPIDCAASPGGSRRAPAAPAQAQRSVRPTSSATGAKKRRSRAHIGDLAAVDRPAGRATRAVGAGAAGLRRRSDSECAEAARLGSDRGRPPAGAARRAPPAPRAPDPATVTTRQRVCRDEATARAMWTTDAAGAGRAIGEAIDGQPPDHEQVERRRSVAWAIIGPSCNSSSTSSTRARPTC